MRPWRTLLFVSIATGIAACGGNDDGTADARSGFAPDVAESDRSYLSEHDFELRPALAARANQLVLLDVRPGTPGQATVEHLTRHRWTAGDYRFCIPAGESALSGMVLEGSDGRVVARLARSDGCVTVTLGDDTYRMRISHPASAIGGASRVGFISPRLPPTPLVGPDGRPVPGWWSLQPDPSLDPLNRRRPGRVTMQTWVGAEQAMVADFASVQFDADSLFNLRDEGHPLVVRSGNSPLGADRAASTDAFLVVRGAGPAALFRTITVVDQGGYSVMLGTTDVLGAGSAFFASDAPTPAGPTVRALWGNQQAQKPPRATPRAFKVQFRYFDDASQLGALNEGEVALFQKCDFQGKVAVFASDSANLTGMSSDVTTLDKTAASVRLGNNTGAFLYSGAGYAGTRTVLKTDAPCLPSPATTSSLLVRPLVNVMNLTTDACQGCKLEGVDLSGKDLSSFDFTGADLTGALLVGANLTSTVLTRALLINADLNNAFLGGATLNNANLEASNLRGAHMTNAHLVGAHLKNANLMGADLTGANFTFANFHSTNDAASTSTCNTNVASCPADRTGFTCGCATASGAVINATNFDAAYLYGADFSGVPAITRSSFNLAIGISSVFTNSAFANNANDATLSDLRGMFLQGALFEPRSIDYVDLATAFVDFTNGGNDLRVLLRAVHTDHAGSMLQGPVCVDAFYSSATTVVANTGGPNVVCPDSAKGGSGGCGLAGTVRWKSGLDIARDIPDPAWYGTVPTYPPPSPPLPVCNGLPPVTGW